MPDSGFPDDVAATRRAWIDQVDHVLERAEIAIGAARAEDAPLAARIELWVDIVTLRKRIAAERMIPLSERQRP